MKLRLYPLYHPFLTAFLIVCGMVLVYYAATFAAHLYFPHRYPNPPIHTTENMK